MTYRVFDASSPGGFREIGAIDVTDVAARTPVWIDVQAASSSEIGQLGRRFGFHELAIEDARKRQQRPKVDIYPDHLFIVLYAIEPGGDDDEDVAVREVSIFLTRSVVITLHPDPVPEIEIAGTRWAEHCRGELPEDVGMLFYTIADSIVDGYFPCMDDVANRIEALESEMFDGGDAEALQAVFRLKRSMLEMRRVVAPTRDVFNAFTRRELPILGESSFAYYQDVYDHVIRVTETIDAYRDTLSSVVEVHLTLVSNRLNQTVRTLTIASIILMSLALIAGVYGMNFHLTPSEDWRWSFPIVIGSMVVVSAALIAAFKRVGWW